MKKILSLLKSSPLYQFLQFSLVGVSNTLISYAVEMLGYYVLFADRSFPGLVNLLQSLHIPAQAEDVRVVIVTLLSFVISVTNAYYWNSRFVFRSGKLSLSAHFRSYLKTAACYALTGLLIAPALKLWLGNFGILFWAASLMTLIVTIPLNFIMNKCWAFARRKEP